MLTEVIILAQGTQKRLGMTHGFKQLLPLPACGNTPIMARTVRQVLRMAPPGREDAAHLYNAGVLPPVAITILSWPDMLAPYPETSTLRLATRCVSLAHPGNSSLKGVARYLETRSHDHPADTTIVLLGDVVYSWACLNALSRLGGSCGFAGTSNLSGSAGELWGVAWARAHEAQMLQDLRDALLRHPPFEDEYQCGQLRRWIVGWRRGDTADHVARLRRAGQYVDVDDYTMDVDLPTDIPKLVPAARAAVLDDAANHLTWTTTP